MSQEEYFNFLYQEMYDMLISYADSAMGQQHALAEELVQDTFKLCWVNLGVVMGSPNPRGWLVDTLKNVIRNSRRSQNRIIKLLLALNSVYRISTTDELDLDTIYGDLKDDPDYILLKEFVVDCRPIKELAQARGISVDNCKKRIQRAKERLKKYFEKNQN